MSDFLCNGCRRRKPLHSWVVLCTSCAERVRAKGKKQVENMQTVMRDHIAVLDIEKQINQREGDLFHLIESKHKVLLEQSSNKSLAELDESIELGKTAAWLLSRRVSSMNEYVMGLTEQRDRLEAEETGQDVGLDRLIEYCNTPVWAYELWNSLLSF